MMCIRVTIVITVDAENTCMNTPGQVTILGQVIGLVAYKYHISNDRYKEKTVSNSECFYFPPNHLHPPQQRSDGEAEDEFAGCEHSFTAEDGDEG